MQELSNDRIAPPPQIHSPRKRAAARRGVGLGVFSVGLGLAELLAPRGVAGLIGVPDTRRTRLVLRALGVRELLAGVGLLTQPRSGTWLWSRVIGDAMDLALLGDGFSKRRAQRGRLIAATAAVAGVTAIDALSAARQSRHASLSRAFAPIHVVRTITINQDRESVYRFWRDFSNLPRFMAHLDAVEEQSNGRTTWRVQGPAGMHVSWDAEVTLDRPGECIAWRSLEGSTSVPNRGVVRFKEAPGGRGTEVHVELKYEPVGAALGAAFAKLFGEEPSQQIAGDLRRLKQVLETGEVLHSDASIHRGPHPARPAAEDDTLQIKGAAQ